MSRSFISRAIVVLLFVIMMFSSQTFSRQFNASLGNALWLQNLLAKDVSQMFSKGKAINIYDTALTLVRNNEVKTTFASIDAIMNIHSEFPTCKITADDVMNILYRANSNFRLTLKLTVLNRTKKKVSVPSKRDVVKSYERFLLCRKGQTDFVDISDSEDVSRVLNKEYGDPIDTNFNQETLKQINFWDDTFQNGTLDDGDYDLWVDIDKIGKKLFESFTTPVQTLFYELPTISSLTAWSNIWSDTDSSSQPGGVFSVLSGLQITGTAPIEPPPPSIDNNQDKNVGALGDVLATADQWIQNFVNDNNNQLYPPNNLYALPASQCASWVAADLTLPSGATTPTIDQYGKIIQASIDALNINPEDTVPQVPNITWATWSTPAIYPSWSPNERVESAVDGIGWECGQDCNWLSEGEQQNCLNTCLKECTAKCEDVSLTNAVDKAYCYSQCLCFTVSWPIWKKWKGMEDMYKIKFCTIPVENNRVTWGKKVYSIEAIFLEIKKVLDSRLNSGETVKRTKPKEYFDTSLSAIKFQDLFSFQITTQVKPLFPAISKSTQAKELTQTNVSYESAILWMTPDDKNKYVVIADVVWPKVDAENIKDIGEYNQKVDDLKNIKEASTSVLSNIISNVSNKNVANLNDEVRDFMTSNLDFWNFTSKALWNINDSAKLLLEGIK